MHRAGAILLLLLTGLSPLFAQEEGKEDDPSVEIDWGDYSSDLYAPGDQTITISLGIVFPTFFFNNGNEIDHNFIPPVGGAGSIAYGYFLSSHFFIGAEIGGMFLFTLAGNTFGSPNLSVKAGYQFNIWKLEFPVSASVGMVWHTYLNHYYYGLYVKGGAAAFFRATPEWSFGLTVNWEWLPEWTGDEAKNIDGNFLGLMISARYHF
jgi:hypothetical protein